MRKFSSRFGYDPKDAKAPVLEEAPAWLRTEFANRILEKILFVDRDTRYKNEEDRPLGTKAILEDFCTLIRQEPEESHYDSWTCADELKSLIKSVSWYNFYDFVELVAKELREQEFWRDDAWRSRFGAARYINLVNELFEKEKVAWRLNSNCELLREIPSAYIGAMASAESGLSKNEFEPARKHYRKAKRYVYERPIDPENGIKEIVSAVESLGKILYPGASTLGDVCKAMKKDKRIPNLLTALVEKFYAFASAEPAVRHGGSVVSNVSLDDAEFCLLVGVASIRYLLSKHDRAI